MRNADGIGADADETDLLTEIGEAITGNGAAQWFQAGLIIIASLVVGRVVRTGISGLIDKTGQASFLGDFLGRIAGYLVVAFGAVYALERVGVQVTPLLGALGVIGIAVAFALQSILENFVAGVLLQVRQPFRKGDEIESQDVSGVIVMIDARTMTVLTPSGEIVRLPNADVIRNPIVNLTQNEARRTTVTVGVAYGTDLQRASDVASAAAQAVNEVHETPAATVRANAFGASSVDLDVMFWHGPTIAEALRARHEVILAIAAAFEEHDITIPFPQRTLRLASEAGRDSWAELASLATTHSESTHDDRH